MKPPEKRPREGVLREEANTVSAEGFIAPSIGALEHALYFTTAPSVTEKAKQVLDQGRLLLPGAVIVWDETIGRRKGAKAIPKGWWADAGSLTVAFAFPPQSVIDLPTLLARTVSAVVKVVASFEPQAEVHFQPPNDLFLGERKVGAVFIEKHVLADLSVVRLNCHTDLAKAPAAIAERACRLVDSIDVKKLRLRSGKTLPNTLLTRLMTEIPKELGRPGPDRA